MSARAMAPRKSATMPIRAINHRCGPGPVEARDGELCEALDGADAAVVGVAPPPDGADAAGVDVGADDAGDVVALGVVVAPVDAPANESAPTARSPLMSPIATIQVSPAAC